VFLSSLDEGAKAGVGGRAAEERAFVRSFVSIPVASH